jgi:signal transduction histidine kinase
MTAKSARWAHSRQDWLPLCIIFSIGALALIVGILWAEARLDDAVRNHALSAAERVTEATAEALQAFSKSDTDDSLSEIQEEAMSLLHGTAGVERMRVIGGDFTVRYDSNRTMIGKSQYDDEVAAILAGGEPILMLHDNNAPISLLGDVGQAVFVAEVYVPMREQGAITGVFELYIDVTHNVIEIIKIARDGYTAFAVAVLLATAGIMAFVSWSFGRRRRDLAIIDNLRVRAETSAERLQAALHHLERFTAYAAHELRNPLAIMLAQIDAMPKSKEADGLRDDVERLMHLIDRLLEYARTESVVVDPDRRMDLGKLARDVVARLFPGFRKAGHDLVLEAPPGAIEIAADPTLIESALRNLIDNAGRHTPPSGTVTVTIALDPIRIEVADHGPGVNPAHLPELMKPFRRGNRAGAAGLGLAIVAETARRVGATLACRATDKQGGATFSLTFGAHQPEG